MKTPRIFGIFLLLCAALLLPAHAQEAVHTGADFEAEGFSNAGQLWDGTRDTWAVAKDGGKVTVSRPDGIAGIYIEFDRLPQPWTLNETEPCGENGFLHEYVNVAARLGEPADSVTLEFPAGTSIGEIYAFSPGELPGWVQVWQPPLEEADLLLVSSHSDDEQLFFAGVLPYYAVERKLAVQVVYLVQHFERQGNQGHQRPHEQLNGLWTVGIRNYPIIPDFPDMYSESKNPETAFAQALKAYRSVDYEYEDFVSYLTGCIRRFKPLVVVSHDLKGEYGHGTHVLCANALIDAVSAAADPAQYPDSASWDPWEIQKLYLHLYEDNQITLDLDTPLNSLGGKSPFQVTQAGFACHYTQQWTWFNKWMNGTQAKPITRAADIKTYSPCLYGLYSTTVGPDGQGGDFFENVDTYADQRAREEAERAAWEAEAARQAEEARLQAEEEARAEAEALRQAQAAQAERNRLLVMQLSVMAGVVLVLCVSLFLVVRRIRRR